MKGMIMSAILSAGLMAGANAKAAENANPFGLVYDGAITENAAGWTGRIFDINAA